jgi:hypothetical protein
MRARARTHTHTHTHTQTHTKIIARNFFGASNQSFFCSEQTRSACVDINEMHVAYMSLLRAIKAPSSPKIHFDQSHVPTLHSAYTELLK